MNKVDNIIEQILEAQDLKTKEKLTQEIIKEFSGYIHKFTIFLCNGKFSKKDRDINELLYILTSKNGNYYHTIEIIKSVLAHYTFEDVLSQLELLFLKCVKRYKKNENGPGFCGYIYSYYKFEIKQWFKHISKDALNTAKIIHIDTTQYERYEYNETDKEKYENICFTDINIINNLEKYILYLSYGLNFTDQEISDLINIHRVRINNMKNSARKKLVNSEILMEDFRVL